MKLFEESLAAAARAVAQRDWATALGISEAIMQQYPDRPDGSVGKASALIQLGRLSEAQTVLLRAMEQFPANVWAAVAYAQLAERQKDWSVALHRWEMVRDKF